MKTFERFIWAGVGGAAVVVAEGLYLGAGSLFSSSNALPQSALHIPVMEGNESPEGRTLRNYDWNRDGSLSFAEFGSVWEDATRLPAGQILTNVNFKMAWENADTNSDGLLNKPEYSTWFNGGGHQIFDDESLMRPKEYSPR